MPEMLVLFGNRQGIGSILEGAVVIKGVALGHLLSTDSFSLLRDNAFLVLCTQTARPFRVFLKDLSSAAPEKQGKPRGRPLTRAYPRRRSTNLFVREDLSWLPDGCIRAA